MMLRGSHFSEESLDRQVYSLLDNYNIMYIAS